jgi:hypothetical protein
VCAAVMQRLTAHQTLGSADEMLAAAAPPAGGVKSATAKSGARSGGRGAKGTAAAGKKKSHLSVEKVAVLGADVGAKLAGMRNEVATSMLCQRPLLRSLLERIKSAKGAGGAQASQADTAAAAAAAATLEELRRSIVMELATGLSQLTLKHPARSPTSPTPTPTWTEHCNDR